MRVEDKGDLFPYQVEVFKDLRPAIQRALVLKSAGAVSSEIHQDLLKRRLTPKTPTLRGVQDLIRRGQEFLGTWKVAEIREIVKAVAPGEYEDELKRRGLVELNGSLFTKEDMATLTKLASGVRPRDLVGKGGNYSTKTSELSYRLYKRLGFSSGVDDAKGFMFRHFSHLVRHEVEMNGKLVVRNQIFSEDESILIFEALCGIDPSLMGRARGFSVEEVATMLQKIYLKIGVEDMEQMIERARESYPIDQD